MHERTPELLAVARSAGLAVLEAPLMVLDPAALPDPATLSDVPVRMLDPDAPTSPRTSRPGGRWPPSASAPPAPRAATPDRPTGTPPPSR